MVFSLGCAVPFSAVGRVNRVAGDVVLRRVMIRIDDVMVVRGWMESLGEVLLSLTLHD